MTLHTLLSRVPLTRRRGDRRPFHGWRIVLLAALAMAMTAPGQTAGVTPFIGPMTTELGLSESTMSTAHLVGTLGAAAALPVVGRLLDTYGPRRLIIVVGVVFGAALAALSMVDSAAELTAGFVAIRVVGQGALGLAAITVASAWFNRRRGLALGVVSAGGFAGIQLTPILLERLIAILDWRQLWQLEGLAVWAIVIPLALTLRDHPHHIGQQVDGDSSAPEQTGPSTGLTRAQAMRTPYFWVMIAVVAVSSLLNTGLVFHQISLLGERGFSSGEAAANFLPQVAAGVAATFLMGHLIDRTRQPKLLVAASIAPLALGLLGATMISPGWSALVYGAIIGASANAVRAVETSLAPRLFGTQHLESIRSLLGSAGATATALGPMLFAVGFQHTGSYVPVLLTSVLLPIAVVAGALAARLPGAVANRTRGNQATDTGATDTAANPMAMDQATDPAQTPVMAYQAVDTVGTPTATGWAAEAADGAAGGPVGGAPADGRARPLATRPPRIPQVPRPRMPQVPRMPRAPRAPQLSRIRIRIPALRDSLLPTPQRGWQVMFPAPQPEPVRIRTEPGESTTEPVGSRTEPVGSKIAPVRSGTAGPAPDPRTRDLISDVVAAR